MNDPAPKVLPFPPRIRENSWTHVATIFQDRAERERRLAWEKLGTGDVEQFHRHISRGEVLDECAAFCRNMETSP